MLRSVIRSAFSAGTRPCLNDTRSTSLAATVMMQDQKPTAPSAGFQKQTGCQVILARLELARQVAGANFHPPMLNQQGSTARHNEPGAGSYPWRLSATRHYSHRRRRLYNQDIRGDGPLFKNVEKPKPQTPPEGSYEGEDAEEVDPATDKWPMHKLLDSEFYEREYEKERQAKEAAEAAEAAAATKAEAEAKAEGQKKDGESPPTRQFETQRTINE
ncbi:hypothetical protein GGR50DRAFT_301866 [Xylaria sp. CBS 124048]|nr:hypothetical protein GGR50DRAFT_301866 [Xylaria sp. CBS 124048]